MPNKDDFIPRHIRRWKGQRVNPTLALPAAPGAQGYQTVRLSLNIINRMPMPAV